MKILDFNTWYLNDFRIKCGITRQANSYWWLRKQWSKDLWIDISL